MPLIQCACQPVSRTSKGEAMIIPKLSCSVVLATAFSAVVGLGASWVPARANVITLNVSATFQPGPAPEACSPTCTISGNIVIDNSFGAANSGFVSANVTAAGFSPSVGPFMTFFGVGGSPTSPNTVLGLNSASVSVLRLAFDTQIGGSFAFYTGGQLSTDSIIDANLGVRPWELTSGSLTPAAAATPEPRSLLLLLPATAGLLGTRSLLRRTASSRP
jgi:hypothetical protein